MIPLRRRAARRGGRSCRLDRLGCRRLLQRPLPAPPSEPPWLAGSRHARRGRAARLRLPVRVGWCHLAASHRRRKPAAMPEKRPGVTLRGFEQAVRERRREAAWGRLSGERVARADACASGGQVGGVRAGYFGGSTEPEAPCGPASGSAPTKGNFMFASPPDNTCNVNTKFPFVWGARMAAPGSSPRAGRTRRLRRRAACWRAGRARERNPRSVEPASSAACASC